MKGFLHRLAARAAGTTVAVRSDARLPFNASKFGRGAAEETADQSSSVGLRPPPSVVNTFALQVDASRVDAPSPIAGHMPPRPSGPMTDGDLGNQARLAFPSPSVGNAEVGLPTPLVREASVNDGHASAFRPESAFEPRTRTADQHSHEMRPSSDSTRLRREPSLLLPPEVSDRASLLGVAAPTTRLPVGIAQVSAREESREVHIHIGRIEVTAVHEAAPPRRLAAPTTPPMSLDAYLAKRGHT
ncbi:MAG: hypothetical protein JWO04_2122 [Gammaproteobacteria bacterium]|nr:hypothetical protein [Gammaproteobacteria bacterium]